MIIANFRTLLPKPGDETIARYIPEAALNPDSFSRFHLKKGDVGLDLSLVFNVLILVPDNVNIFIVTSVGKFEKVTNGSSGAL
jgi:hypothetical protein